MSNPLRSIPSVNELIDRPPLRRLVNRVSHNVVVSGVRDFLEQLRTDVQEATSDIQIPDPSDLAERIADWIVRDERPPLRPVINATGILLHTGLGRAPWPETAIREVEALASGYCSLEIDLEDGQRSQRVVAVERLLRHLTGAEAACVVNNNAAATVLTLGAVANNQEVIVSRGQLIEIGGSYRLPDVMSSSGARLREVGTTNKTRISDYASAINDSTGALLRVHSSNFRIVGFTEEPTIDEIAQLGHQHQLPVIDDIGSGALVEFRPYGVTDEPIAGESIKAGADLVLFSGDKLLGGPQCGIIVGKRVLVRQISKHPLMRAMRLDKVILGALASTLRLYRDAATARAQIPLLAFLETPIDNLQNRAERLTPQLAACPAIATAEPVAGHTYLGGGSVPTQELPTWCVAISPSPLSIDELAAALRTGNPAVFGRIQNDQLLFDLRSVFPRQDSELVEAVQAVGQSDETPVEIL
jgi:L-seryl-tRNA(Ser) seleniumtransferase